MIGSCQGVKIYFVTIPAHKIPVSGGPGEQRLLGLLAETGRDPGAGLRHRLRPAGQHQGKAGRQRRERGQLRERPDHGLPERPERPSVRLGDPRTECWG